MNWNTEGRACFSCLMLIMNYLLKLPLNSEREGVNKIFFLLLILTHPTMFGTEISNLFFFNFFVVYSNKLSNSLSRLEMLYSYNFTLILLV